MVRRLVLFVGVTACGDAGLPSLSTSGPSSTSGSTADSGGTCAVDPDGPGCEVCENAVDDEGSPVTVTLRNDADVVLYIVTSQPSGGGYSRRQEYVLVGDGETQPLVSHLDTCDANACSDYVSGSACIGCDPGPPSEYGLLHLVPGATYAARPWNNLVWVDTSVAKVCVSPDCDDVIIGSEVTCGARRLYDGASVTAVAEAFSLVDGDDCEPGADGWCLTPFGTQPDGSRVLAEAVVAIPATAIELAFVF